MFWGVLGSIGVFMGVLESFGVGVIGWFLSDKGGFF